ncbi:MAG: hypothetical protein ACSHX8_09600 [Opitutaceae bacterium]
MHITSSYFRCRQHKDTLDLGVSGGLVRVVEKAALDTETKFCVLPNKSKPLRPSKLTLRRLANRYKSNNNSRVA